MIFLSIVCAIIVVLGIIIPAGLIKGCEGDRYGERKKVFLKKCRLLIPVIVGALFLVITIISSIHIIDSTEVGVVRTFGRITGTLNSGMNFTNPFSETVTIYDTKVRARELAFASYTKDAQAIDVVVEVQYELPRDTIQQVAAQYGTYETLEAKLGNVIEERIKVVLARLSAMTLMETRSDLSMNALIEVQELQITFPVRFTSVIVKDVAFSDAFEASVEAKMTAEQSALRAEQEKKEAIIRAEQQREVAKIEAEAAVAAAQGESDAMMITKEALEAMPESYIERMWIERWNGVLPQFMTEGSNLLISPNIGD